MVDVSTPWATDFEEKIMFFVQTSVRVVLKESMKQLNHRDFFLNLPDVVHSLVIIRL